MSSLDVVAIEINQEGRIVTPAAIARGAIVDGTMCESEFMKSVY